MTPFRATEPYDWSVLLYLVQICFAELKGRINPTSSMYRMTLDSVSNHARTGEIWVIEMVSPIACVFLEPRKNRLYLSKLSVHPKHRRRGHASRLLRLAEQRANQLGLEALTLETRVELIENHALFKRHGFYVTEKTSHPGFDRPTSLSMRKDLAQGPLPR